MDYTVDELLDGALEESLDDDVTAVDEIPCLPGELDTLVDGDIEETFVGAIPEEEADGDEPEGDDPDGTVEDVVASVATLLESTVETGDESDEDDDSDGLDVDDVDGADEDDDEAGDDVADSLTEGWGA